MHVVLYSTTYVLMIEILHTNTIYTTCFCISCSKQMGICIENINITQESVFTTENMKKL